MWHYENIPKDDTVYTPHFFINNKNRLLEDGVVTSDIGANKETKKIRILGLTNPEKGLQIAKQKLEEQGIDSVIDVIDKCGGDVGALLSGGKIQEGSGFHSSTYLASSDVRINQSDFLLKRRISGYTFEHGFALQERGPGRLSMILIDSYAIKGSIGEIGKVDFQKLEKALGILYCLANHDYTMHGLGLLNSNFPELKELIDNNLDLGNLDKPTGGKYWPGEILSGLLHKDLVQEFQEQNPNIKKSILKNTRTVLNIINGLGSENLKKYWIEVLLYPLLSIIGDGDILEQLQKEFPDIGLKSGKWGKLMSLSEVKFGGKSFTVREFREMITHACENRDISKLKGLLK